MKAAILSTPSPALSGIQFQIQQTILDDPERPESKDNCTKYEVRRVTFYGRRTHTKRSLQ